MVDNKCANIFSTTEVDLSSKHLDTWKHIAWWCLYHWDLYCKVLTECAWNVCMHLFMGHIVSKLFLQPVLFIGGVVALRKGSYLDFL